MEHALSLLGSFVLGGLVFSLVAAYRLRGSKSLVETLRELTKF